ncbi:hypothetical protein D4764_01G0010450 [Takifugu flavidus]|uniref:Uncharacterized protein n=1 Tax=Takifugu flavidus TaxID=433684 RepID=A0A5C6PSH8_9TELE|nr:hypothetical protein D4764_01G0010450 [Takifugu flavidus]
MMVEGMEGVGGGFLIPNSALEGSATLTQTGWIILPWSLRKPQKNLVPKVLPRVDGYSCVGSHVTGHPFWPMPKLSPGSLICAFCQLLSRQCRSCVAISSYIWLLGL